MPFRLLLVNDHGIEGGGAEGRIKLFAKHFLQADPQNTLTLASHAQLSKQSITDLFPEHQKQIRHIFLKGNWKTQSLKLLSILKKERINLVQGHNLLVLSPQIFAYAQWLKIPSIWFAHDYWPLCANRTFFPDQGLCLDLQGKACQKCLKTTSRLRLKLMQKLLSFCNLAIAPSAQLINIYENHGLLKGKWQLIDPWVNLQEFSFEQNFSENQQILYVGALKDYKGAKHLAQAMPHVLKKHPQAQLKVISPQVDQEGFSENPISKMLKQLPCPVTFAAKCSAPELAQEFSASTLFVCPSQWPEPFGLVWAESLSRGCPVVATNIGGMKDYLPNYAQLCAVNDTQSLAQAIIHVLDQPPSLEHKKQASKYIQDRFAPQRAWQELKVLYYKLQESSQA